MNLPDRTPVSIITGFLGSGKTTLLNRLLRDPSMAGAVVIVNEFGEVGLDHLLIATPNENAVVLSSGCICCTVRGDLVDTLRDLDVRRSRGDLPPFDRVLIETTGLADPVPIIQTVVTDEQVAPRFHLDGVITLVDAVNGADQLDRQSEAVKQSAVADRLLITKTDLAPPSVVEGLRQRLAHLNPGAQTFAVVRGEIGPECLSGAGLDGPADPEAVRRWLAAEAYAQAEEGTHRHEHGHEEHDADRNRHDEHIRAYCLHLDRPVSAAGVMAWLTALASMRGADLLRVKGLLNVEGQPVAVHAVQTLIHEPVALERWPDADRRSRLVFIVRDMTRAEIEATLSVLHWQAGPHAAPGRLLDPQAYARFVTDIGKFHS
ncbi:MAG: GTP-binding protein [Burkholderiales bacterium]|nr:GTP-binding protein [Burkholderiales bacterium]